MERLVRIILFALIPFYAFSQEKMDPFQIYGPYKAKIYESFSQALNNADDCHRLKSHNEDLSKNLKKIKKLNKLYVIDLKSNNIDTLPEEICSFQNLMYLKSSGNALRKLPETIGSTPTIKSLILHHVNLDSLPNSFKGLRSLMELEIQINNADTLNLKDGFSGLYNLKSLMLYKANLKAFPTGLNHSKKLKKVLMVDCGLQRIDSSFTLMEDLQTLILDKNNFEQFPLELIEIKTLKELSLRANKLTSIPEKLGKLRGLQLLDLTGNNIPMIEVDILRTLLPHCKIII